MSNDTIQSAIDYAKARGLKTVSCELRDDPCQAYANLADLKNAEVLVLVGELNQMIKAKAKSLQLKGAKLIVVNDTDNRFNRLADADLCELSALEIEEDVKTVFIYNREDLSLDQKNDIKKLMSTLDHSTAWVNSNYLNTRGMEAFDIESVDELNTKHAIVFGKTPDNLSADKIYRLPLRPFRVEGSVVNDFGEEIIL